MILMQDLTEYLFRVSGLCIAVRDNYSPDMIYRAARVRGCKNRVRSWTVEEITVALDGGRTFSATFSLQLERGNISYQELADFIQQDIGNDNFRAALVVAKLKGELK